MPAICQRVAGELPLVVTLDEVLRIDLLHLAVLHLALAVDLSPSIFLVVKINHVIAHEENAHPDITKLTVKVFLKGCTALKFASDPVLPPTCL